MVGGGAAGLATAIFAARAAPGLRVVVLDGARKIGAKILVSGGSALVDSDGATHGREAFESDSESSSSRVDVMNDESPLRICLGVRFELTFNVGRT